MAVDGRRRCLIVPAGRSSHRGFGSELRSGSGLSAEDGLGSAAGRFGATGFAHSTVWKVLHRSGLSGRPRWSRSPPTATSGPAPAICCTWTQAATPGFCGPATGHRRPLATLTPLDAPRTRVGYDYAHAIVDDHSRLAYVELHPDEKAATVTGFVERALAFFAQHGIVAKRLMTDNGFSYVKNRSLRELLARHGIRHLTTQPYRPRTNGKVERFHQTMAREWAYGLSYRSHHHRNHALPHWLDHYNRHRPHSSLGNRRQPAAFTTSVGRTPS